MYHHQPVFLHQAVDALVGQQADGIYIDATYGRGGHSDSILQRLSSKSQLHVFDRDGDAIAHANQKAQHDPRIHTHQNNFRDMSKTIKKIGALGHVDGILLDIGVSSTQLDDPSRGFSFSKTGPLDMRMDNSRGMTALQWLKRTSTADIAKSLRQYGDVSNSIRWAKSIKQQLSDGALENTTDLSKLILEQTPVKVQQQKKHHPATKIFQALRIAVNDEINALSETLHQSIDLLKTGGKLVVITFHSLEHRLVRKAARGPEQKTLMKLPTYCMDKPWNIIQLLAFPSEEEFEHNRRARSARLSILQKLGSH